MGKFKNYLWNKFQFVLTPKELQEVLRGFYHVVDSHRVPFDYTKSDETLFFNQYKNLYDVLVSGKKLIWKQDYKILDVQTAIADNLNKCSYTDVFLDGNNSQFYKLCDFDEPQVGISLFCLKIDCNKKLNSKCSLIQFPEFVVGLSISYPKKVIFSTKTLNYDEIESYRVYK